MRPWRAPRARSPVKTIDRLLIGIRHVSVGLPYLAAHEDEERIRVGTMRVDELRPPIAVPRVGLAILHVEV